MRSKEIGNSSQTEKRLLRDMEVFSSPQFLRLVQRIGKEITDKHDAQIRFYSDATDHRAGYFVRMLYLYQYHEYAHAEFSDFGSAKQKFDRCGRA